MASYTVPIASETKAFKQGIETGIIKPVEDANKELKELGENRGPEQLERDIRDAQKSTEKLADETKDTARVIEREYRDSFRKVKASADDAHDGIQRGAKEAKRGVEEFGDEANSTAREAAASFDGSAESIGDAFQEVAANAFAGFGPAGAAAGLVAAAGLGAAMSAITDQQEAADELKRRLTAAYIAAAEEGRNYLSVQQIIEESGAIYEDAERLAAATKDAADLNLDRKLVIQAMAGDEEALNVVIAAGNDLIDQSTDKTGVHVGLLNQITDKYEEQLGLQDTQKANADEYLSVIQEQNDKQAAGNKAAKDALDVRGAALDDYAKKAASIPNPVLVPQLDTSTLDGEISRFIARPRAQIELEAKIFYKDQAGRQILP